jgi:hypothetical protein
MARETREQLAFGQGRALGRHATGGDGWLVEAGGEPRLDELLDDPIMGLLWRGDRLEAGSARATVMALRELVRSRPRSMHGGMP